MSIVDDKPMSMQFLLKWNRNFYWIFIMSYTLSTIAFAMSGSNFGFSEYLRLFTITVVSVALILSYAYKSVYNSIYKVSYFVVFLILANTTVLAYNNPDSPLALVYMGSSTMILTYMYLDIWYLLAYQVAAVSSIAFITYHSYGNSIKHAIIGAVIESLLMFYVTVFLRIRKMTDAELDHEVTNRRRESALRLDAERRLVEVSKLYKDIVDLAPYQIATMDISGRYTYVNNAVNMNEQMRFWLIGKTDRDYFTATGGNLSVLSDIEAAFAKCIEIKEPVMIDVTSATDDKIRIPFQRNKIFVPIVSNGAVERIAVYG